MQLEVLLQSFGLDEKEAKVYLASLSLGTASVYEIAIKSNLKRPTTYLVVDELLEKELLFVSKIGNKTYYKALPPKKLIESWEEKINTLQNSTSELENLKKDTISRPFVQFYENPEELAEMYAELRPQNVDVSEYLLLGSFDAFVKANPQNSDHWLAYCHDNNMFVREILDNTRDNRKYAQKSNTAHNKHEIRLLPKKLHISKDVGRGISNPYKNLTPTLSLPMRGGIVPRGTFEDISCALVGDSFYIITNIRDVFGIKIKHPVTSQVFRMMFEMSWGMAEVVRE